MVGVASFFGGSWTSVCFLVIGHGWSARLRLVWWQARPPAVEVVCFLSYRCSMTRSSTRARRNVVTGVRRGVKGIEGCPCSTLCLSFFP